MTDTVFDEVVARVAKDLGVEEDALRILFTQWMAGSRVSQEDKAICYAVYRLTKCKAAFRIATQSRDRWRTRAIELGSPSHLNEDD